MIIHGDGNHLDKGNQAWKAGNHAEALAHFQAHVDSHPDDPLGWCLLGDRYRDLDDFTAAEATYTTAIDCPPEVLPIHERYLPHYRRGLLYQYMGKYRAALGDMAHAGYFVSDEAWTDPYQYSFFAKVRAELYEALGQFNLAMKAYENYYRDHHQDSKARLRAPEIRRLEAQLQHPLVFGALSWSGAVPLSVLPDPAVPASLLEAIQAEIHAWGEGEPLLKLTEQLPEDARGWRYLGCAYWYGGQDAKARNAFARAFQLAPQAPENLFVQGCLAYFDHDMKQAMRCFNEAETLGLPVYERDRLHQYRGRL